MPEPLAERIERIIERVTAFEKSLTALEDAAERIQRDIHDIKEECAGYPDELFEAKAAMYGVQEALNAASEGAAAARNALRCAAKEKP